MKSKTLGIIGGILFLLQAIISKENTTYKDIIVTNLYEKNLSFTKMKNLYK